MEIERRIEKVEFRVVRDDSGKLKTLAGYGAKYNTRSLPLGYFEDFYETIAPGAFDETLANGDDVRFLFNHDANVVLGRTTSRTLRLRSDTVGLAFEVDPPDTQAARDIVTSVERGDISQCSFAFDVIDADWSEENVNMLRTLRKVKLYDVSAVTYPAYPDTEVQVRARERIVADAKRQLGKLPEQVEARLSAYHRDLQRKIRIAEVGR
jgi:uncharacterized protein